MGKNWDGIGTWLTTAVWRECLRVLKPGGHALVWAIPRTSHWTATAVEDAGFEIRDVIAHLFGSGFPKSLDVSKTIDKAAGAEREVVGRASRPDGSAPCDNCIAPKCSGNAYANGVAGGDANDKYITVPATAEAAQWSGWGTALKPAREDWILARKPLDGTVASNVLRYGTGAINVDACRVATGDDLNGGAYVGERRERDERTNTGTVPGAAFLSSLDRGLGEFKQPVGRWPANLVLSHSECAEDACAPDCPVAELDRQSGDSTSIGGSGPASKNRRGDGRTVGAWMSRASGGFGDTGGASRFFYTAKASRSERDAGLAHLPASTGGQATDRKDGSAGLDSPRTGAGRKGGARNTHPTVKPLDLMRWLCRLITPPGGIVLDPFAGSGSTLIAALREGFKVIGVERDPQYVTIARARVEEDAPLFHRLRATTPEAELESRQLTFLDTPARPCRDDVAGENQRGGEADDHALP